MRLIQEQQLLKTSDMAELLSIDRRTVWQRCQAGRIPHVVTVTGRMEFRVAEVLRDALLDQGAELLEVWRLSGQDGTGEELELTRGPDGSAIAWIAWPPTRSISNN